MLQKFSPSEVIWWAYHDVILTLGNLAIVEWAAPLFVLDVSLNKSLVFMSYW